MDTSKTLSDTHPPLQLLQRPAVRSRLAEGATTPFDRQDSLAAYHAARRWRARVIAVLLRLALRRAARWLKRAGAPRARCAVAADTW